MRKQKHKNVKMKMKIILPYSIKYSSYPSKCFSGCIYVCICVYIWCAFCNSMS